MHITCSSNSNHPANFTENEVTPRHSGLQTITLKYWTLFPFAWGISVQKCVSPLGIRNFVYLKPYQNVPVIWGATVIKLLNNELSPKAIRIWTSKTLFLHRSTFGSVSKTTVRPQSTKHLIFCLQGYFYQLKLVYLYTFYAKINVGRLWQRSAQGLLWCT